MWQGYGCLSRLDAAGKFKTLKEVAKTPDLIILHRCGIDSGCVFVMICGEFPIVGCV
ncbi:hypothetical protein DPMN_077302, partial [Dreissena polymorpha]